MTENEMTQIFSLITIAYPASDIAKNKNNLLPAIKLWTAALPDVDFQTGQQAMMELFRTCKFPPSIAEFKETADRIKEKQEAEIFALMMEAKNMISADSASPKLKAIIRALGGQEALYLPVPGRPGEYWINDDAIRAAYLKIKNSKSVDNNRLM